MPLATHFLGIHSEGKSKRLDSAAKRALLEYDWPGNVRDLENRIQRAILVSSGDTITAEDLGLPTGASKKPSRPPSGESLPATKPRTLASGTDPSSDKERAEIEQAPELQASSRGQPPSSASAVKRSIGAWSASA